MQEKTFLPKQNNSNIFLCYIASQDKERSNAIFSII